MSKTEDIKLMLTTYAETQSPVTQEFYQGLCLKVVGAIGQLQEELEVSEKLLSDLGFRKKYNTENRRLQEELTDKDATINHLRKKAEFDMPSEMHGLFHNGGCTDPCDMMDGPCACGAWHNVKEWVGKLFKRIKQLEENT